jgi:hypothetical protein
MAKALLRLDDTNEYDDELERWILARLMSMGGVDMFKVINTTLDVIDGIAPMPNGVSKFLAIRFCDGDNGASYGAYYVDTLFLDSCFCDVDGQRSPYGAVFTIVGNNIRFINPVSAPEKIQMAYKGHVTDGDGFIMIKDYMAYGLAGFAAFNFAITHYERFTQEQRMEFKKIGIGGANHARARQQVEKFMRSGFENAGNFTKKTISL